MHIGRHKYCGQAGIKPGAARLASRARFSGTGAPSPGLQSVLSIANLSIKVASSSLERVDSRCFSMLQEGASFSVTTKLTPTSINEIPIHHMGGNGS